VRVGTQTGGGYILGWTINDWARTLYTVAYFHGRHRISRLLDRDSGSLKAKKSELVVYFENVAEQRAMVDSAEAKRIQANVESWTFERIFGWCRLYATTWCPPHESSKSVLSAMIHRAGARTAYMMKVNVSATLSRDKAATTGVYADAALAAGQKFSEIPPIDTASLQCVLDRAARHFLPPARHTNQRDLTKLFRTSAGDYDMATYIGKKV
jgi:hypothetical protein